MTWTRRALAVLALGAALAGCAKHAAQTDVPCRDRKPESSDIVIAPPGEPGERLEVTGAVYRRGRAGAVAGVTIYAYHSDSTGSYTRSSGGRFNPRLCGILRTDSLDRYRIRTIMPGHAEGTPHIHFEVWGKGLVPRSLVLNLSSSPRLVAPENPLLAWPPGAKGRQSGLARDSSGVYHCTWDILLE